MHRSGSDRYRDAIPATEAPRLLQKNSGAPGRSLIPPAQHRSPMLGTGPRSREGAVSMFLRPSSHFAHALLKPCSFLAEWVDNRIVHSANRRTDPIVGGWHIR